MQEITHELHIIWQAYKKEIEAQKQGFKIELEQVSGKIEQLKLRSKMLENKVRTFRSSKQQTARNFLSQTKTVMVFSNNT